MPTTQRPFLSNFLAAFRAHQHQLPKTSPSLSTSSAVSAAAAAAATQTVWTSAAHKPSSSSLGSENATASPRPINPKTQSPSTSSQQQPYHHHTASLSPPSLPLQHNVSPQTHLPRSPPSPGVQTTAYPGPSYPTPQEAQPWSSSRAARRGSASSAESGGLKEVKGPSGGGGGAGAAGSGEKWFIGGRTAAGEEKFYALSKIRRDRSSDRISTDQLSL